VGKGKRADVYLEVRKRRGAYIFWMKQVPVVHNSCLAWTKVGARQPLLKTHTTTWTDCFTFTSANKIL
jgi:hypothetical protein